MFFIVFFKGVETRGVFLPPRFRVFLDLVSKPVSKKVILVAAFPEAVDRNGGKRAALVGSLIFSRFLISLSL